MTLWQKPGWSGSARCDQSRCGCRSPSFIERAGYGEAFGHGVGVDVLKHPYAVTSS